MKFVFIIFTFVFSNFLNGHCVYFEFHQKTNPESNIIAKMYEEGTGFLKLNGNSIFFYTIPSSLIYGTKNNQGESTTKIISSVGRGCAPLSTFLVGTNSLSLTFSFHGVTLVNGWFEGSLYLVNNRNQLELICSSLVQSGDVRGSCQSSLKKELREINPRLAREIELLEEEFKNLKRFEKVEEFERGFEKAGELLSLLKNSPLEDVSEDSFNLFKVAQATILNLKKDIHTLKREIESTHKEIQNCLQNTKQKVEDELAREGLKITDLPNVDLNFSTETIIIPNLELSTPFNESDNIYKAFADKTIETLQSYLKNNDRTAFLSEVLVWVRTADTYAQIAINRDTFSKKEWQTSQKHYERVHDYIYSHIDKDFWFKDSPVPVEVRMALQSEIRALAPQESSTLETVLKKLSQKDLTDQQRRGIEFVQALDVVAKAIVRTAENSIETIQEFRGYVKETVNVISTGVKCLSQSQVSGRLGSLYELFSGKDQCSGSELSEWGRIFAGVELALGTPKVFTVLGSVVGIGGVGLLKGKKVAETLKVSEKILESAKKLKIPSNDLKRVINSANHVFGSKGLTKHKMSNFLAKHNGDAVSAFKSIENTVQSLVNEGKIPKELFKDIIVKVEGSDLTVRGNVIDGVVKLSTVFIP